MDFHQFANDYRVKYASNLFADIYNGYYDYKNPIPFEFENLPVTSTTATIDSLFSDERVDDVYTIIALKNDIATLRQIVDKTLAAKTFDYNGIKYNKSESVIVLADLEKELETLSEKVRQNDIAIYQFFRSLDDKGELQPMYIRFFKADREFETRYGVYTKISAQLHFIQYTLPIEQISANLQQVAATESELKQGINALLDHPDYQTNITAAVKDSFQVYLQNNGAYFEIDQYNNRNLEVLFSALNNYADLLSTGLFSLKKAVLDYQDELWKRRR